MQETSWRERLLVLEFVRFTFPEAALPDNNEALDSKSKIGMH
jgi:hypothetical protein